MVVAVAIKNLVLFAAVFLVRDLAHHFEGFLVRLGPAVHVIDAGETRHLGDQLFGVDRAGNGASGPSEIVQLDQLVAYCIGDRLAAIADVDGPDAAGNRIEMFLPVLVPDMDALAFYDDAGIGGLIRLVLAEVVPDMGLVGLYNMRNIVLAECAIHDGPFRMR